MGLCAGFERFADGTGAVEDRDFVFADSLSFLFLVNVIVPGILSSCVQQIELLDSAARIAHFVAIDKESRNLGTQKMFGALPQPTSSKASIIHNND